MEGCSEAGVEGGCLALRGRRETAGVEEAVWNAALKENLVLLGRVAPFTLAGELPLPATGFGGGELSGVVEVMLAG